MTDVTEFREHDRRNEYRANHDALTGLVNRERFAERVHAAIAEAQRARRTEAALAEAREALLGYAMRYRDLQIATGTNNAMYGYVPLPDLGTLRNQNIGCDAEGCAIAANYTGADRGPGHGTPTDFGRPIPLAHVGHATTARRTRRVPVAHRLVQSRRAPVPRHATRHELGCRRSPGSRHRHPETVAAAILGLGIVALGVWPAPLLDLVAGSVDRVGRLFGS